MKSHRHLTALVVGLILAIVLPSVAWPQAAQDRKEETILPNVKVSLEKLSIANAPDDLKQRYNAYFVEFNKEIAARAASFSKDCEFTLRLLAADRTKVVLMEVGLSKKGDPKEMISSCQFYGKGKPAAEQAPLAEVIKPCLDRVVTYAKCGK